MQPEVSVADVPGPAAQSRAPRPLKPLTDRLLIIGLDGATFYVLDPLMNAGRMPNLKRFIEQGTAGVLHSTQPPITPAAWTTFMTGKGPGQHGILDFEKYDVFQHQLTFNSTYQIEEKTIWELLSEKGLRVGSINVPMTFPPKPINGFMISGFETPSIDAEFTYPRELKQEIFQQIPNYNYRTNWQRRALGGQDVLETNLEYIANSFEQGYRLTTYCGDKYGWDVLMTVMKLVDNLQHKAWKYLDPQTAGNFPREAELAARVFTRLDDVLGRMFEYAERNNATVLIMSDHGHGSLDGKAQPNLLLKRWGYLALRSPWQQANTRAAYWWHRFTKGKATRFEQGSRGIERELAVDWTRTRACVMHAGIYGYLYINLKGRGPHGIVEPADYEPLRNELIERLRSASVRDRNGREVRIFPHVYKTETLYHCDRGENPNLPDLLLAPNPGLAVIRKIRGGQPVRWCKSARLEGTHRDEGILALGGANVRHGQRTEASIIDIAPTMLAALGLRVPVDMEGRVIREAFTTDPVIEREPPLKKAVEEAVEVYSDSDRRILEERLTELGYLE
ncbi:MAG TPA: alkaline phosphatase family protein [Phycisphaerae bacterium]|jgi:predicted AlkP superfamily phosphohydrolase/phosphomutase|nr:alkaline phosphatase family protein [Phycisphaerae bacterium]HPC22685.1 alkaline phosphatase family protein [Phycisphaerae bacterium]